MQGLIHGLRIASQCTLTAALENAGGLFLDRFDAGYQVRTRGDVVRRRTELVDVADLSIGILGIVITLRRAVWNTYKHVLLGN